MTIRIHVENAPESEAHRTFEDDVDEIVIGRNAERCQVVLPMAMTVVGREHLALRRQLGRYRLVLNASNPVWVDGQPAIDGMELPLEAELQLGENGPRLHVETLLPASLPQTMMGGAVPVQTPETLRAEAQRRSRANRRFTTVLALLLVAAVGIGIYALLETRKQAEDAQRELNRLVDARLSEIKRETETRRQAAVDAIESRLDEVEDLRPDIVGLRKAMQGIGPQLKGLEDRIETIRPKIQEALRRAEKSVYLVFTRGERSTDTPVATAWVVAENTLATNAHVAEGFNKLKEGQTLWVRTPGENPRDIQVTGIKLHPGFKAFTELWKKHAPTRLHMGRGLERLNEVPSCDVALLHVAEGSKLDDPLPLAPAEALHALGPGDVVGFVGFPLEDMAGGAVNMQAPSATIRVGHLTSVTNFFLGRTSPEGSLLVQHSMTTVGGTSGSPVLDSQGRVIAVHNAGNFVFVGGKRVPGADVNFAQRVDLLKELLDAREVEIQDARTKRWEAGIVAFDSLRSLTSRAAQDYLKQTLGKKAQELGVGAELIHEESGLLDSPDGGKPADWTKDWSFDTPGLYVVFAWSTSAEDINLLIVDPARTEIVSADRYADYFPLAHARIADTRDLRLIVQAGQDVSHGEFHLQIHRFPMPAEEAPLPSPPPAEEPDTPQTPPGEGD